jgi:hypothetical protein
MSKQKEDMIGRNRNILSEEERKSGRLSPGWSDDEIDAECKKIAKELSLTSGWTVSYAGSPLQTKHFTIHKGSGRFFQHHPAMPRGKTIHDPNGWHVNDLDKMLEVLK